MYIPVKIEATNFQSFESLVYNFKQGKSVLIQGENLSDEGQESNGAGKSTLQEIVYYACIGSSSTGKRDIKLIRRGEKESEIIFTLFNTVEKSTLRIERTLHLKKSSTLRIFINDQDQSGQFATVNDGNSYLIRLLGIDSEDLKNFYLINRDRFTPFFKLSDTQSRDLISRFANISFLDKIDNKIQQEISDHEKDYEDSVFLKRKIEDKILSIESKIIALQDQIVELKTKSSPEEIQRIKDSAIKRIQNEILGFESEIESILKNDKLIIDNIEKYKKSLENSKNIQKYLNNALRRLKQISYTKKYEDLEKKILSLQNKKSSLREESGKLENQILDLQRERSNLDNILAGTITCPSCKHKFLMKQEVSVEEAFELLKEVEVSISDLKKEVDVISEKQKNIDIEIKSLKPQEVILGKQNTKKNNLLRSISAELTFNDPQVFEQKIRNAQQTLNSSELSISKLKNKIDLKNSEIVDIREKQEDNTLVIENINTSIQKLKKSLETETAELKEVNDILDEINEEIENKKKWQLNFKQFYIYLTNKCLRNIQDICNRFLEKFNTNLRVQIEGFKTLANNSVKEKITTVILRDEIEEDDYRSFSGGERGKLILATILTFQELINSNSSTGGLDVLFIDEILDAVDSEGMKGFIDALNSTTKTIHLTTHIGIKDREENVLLIRKINDKSYLVE